MISIQYLHSKVFEPIEYIEYPGGEISIQTIIQDSSYLSTEVSVKAIIENSRQLMVLALLKDILDSMGYRAVLELPYVPYARQDRVIHGKKGNQALSIKVLANFINAMKFERVLICDPHSTVTPALINNVIVHDRYIMARDLLSEIRYESKTSGLPIVLVAPDIGAVKEVSDIAEKFGLPYTYAIKERDPETGHLKITGMNNVELLHGAHMVVLDDICDGGYSFIALSKFIQNQWILRGQECVKPAKKTLYVTHGIFSKGVDELLSHYDEVVSKFLFEAYKNLLTSNAKHVEKNLYYHYFVKS